jgi:UDP-2,4-diacetamido-2,4,6-trideoxy-beta-L-altropyranose hydrolase
MVGTEARLKAAGYLVRMIGGGGSPDELAHSAWLEGAQSDDAAATLAALGEERPDWIVVDHYALDARWERMLRKHCDRLMVIDDLADRAHECDLLLDQNLHSTPDLRYMGIVPGHCRMLLGPRFALLRPEFAEARSDLRDRDGSVRRILVFFGGVDACNQTERVMQVLSSGVLREAKVDVVIGLAHPRRSHIIDLCARLNYQCHVQTENMAALMASADLAIGAGGTATWERCCVGLPALVWPQADNQRMQLEIAAINGLVHAPDGVASDDEILLEQLNSLRHNPLCLKSQARAGLHSVDGNGAARVCRALGVTGISMREATPDDCNDLFEWRNRDSVRLVSHDTRKIDPVAHEKWLSEVIMSDDRKLLIGERREKAVGVVRFDLSGEVATISIYLVPGDHGSGAGGDLLAAAEHWLFHNASRKVHSIRAEVLGDNDISARLFLAAGYRVASTYFVKATH